jgi:hypothetical protein
MCRFYIKYTLLLILFSVKPHYMSRFVSILVIARFTFTVNCIFTFRVIIAFTRFTKCDTIQLWR